MKNKQLQLFTAQSHFLSYGGKLRMRRKGRQARPLSAKYSHHIVFKVNQKNLKFQSLRHPKNFHLVQALLRRYSLRFFMKVEQISYQHNHIHIMARSSRRSNFHNFFRVFCGQMAQNLKIKVTDTPSLWIQRPFTRIVKGWKNYVNLRNYIQLNELEVCGRIAYQKNRLRNKTLAELESLWTTYDFSGTDS